MSLPPRVRAFCATATTICTVTTVTGHSVFLAPHTEVSMLRASGFVGRTDAVYTIGEELCNPLIRKRTKPLRLILLTCFVRCKKTFLRKYTKEQGNKRCPEGGQELTTRTALYTRKLADPSVNQGLVGCVDQSNVLDTQYR